MNYQQAVDLIDFLNNRFRKAGVKPFYLLLWSKKCDSCRTFWTIAGASVSSGQDYLATKVSNENPTNLH